VATSTRLGFFGGFVSTASSTINADFNLGTTTAFDITSGRFGVGTTTPRDPLSVQGNVSFSGANDYRAFFFNAENGRLGLGTTSPSSRLSVSGNTWLDSNVITLASSSAATLTVDYRARATSTIPASTNYAWTIATSTTADPIIEISTDGRLATTSVAGSFDINSGALQYDSGANITSIERLNLGNLSFDDDAGTVSWIDFPVTAAPPAETPQSYSAQIDSNELLTIYAQADSNGGINDARVIVGTSTDAILGSSNIPFASFIVADGALCVDDGSGSSCDDAALSTGYAYAHGFSAIAGGAASSTLLTTEVSSLRISGQTNCDTFITDSTGYLSCGTDATGAGGGVDTIKEDNVQVGEEIKISQLSISEQDLTLLNHQTLK